MDSVIDFSNHNNSALPIYSNGHFAESLYGFGGQCSKVDKHILLCANMWTCTRIGDPWISWEITGIIVYYIIYSICLIWFICIYIRVFSSFSTLFTLVFVVGFLVFLSMTDLSFTPIFRVAPTLFIGVAKFVADIAGAFAPPFAISGDVICVTACTTWVSVTLFSWTASFPFWGIGNCRSAFI